jgi:WD40 repeat protein
VKRLIILLVLALTALAVFAQSRVVLSLGHTGKVNDAVGHPTEPVAFTVGDDGRLLVWDLEQFALLHRYQVSRHPISMIVHHPEEDQVAVVVDEGVDRTSIRVLDWRSGSEIFRHDIDASPVHLAYSPAGTYLMFALPSFRSLHFLDAESGQVRSYLDDGFGIVNFTQMGRSERNIMTYVPVRGEFIYWGLQAGNELQRVSTLDRLEHLTLVDPENRRAIAAATDGDLVIVDNLTGDLRASYPLSPIFGIEYDHSNDRIMVLTEQFGRRVLLSFNYSDSRLRREFFQPNGLSETATLAVAVTGESGFVLAGDEAGAVDLFRETSGRRVELGPAPTAAIVDIAFTEGRMHLSLGDRIISLVSEVFESNRRSGAIPNMRQTVTRLGEMRGARLEAWEDQVLVFGDGEEPYTVLSLSPPSTGTVPVYTDESESPVLDVRATDGGPVIVHRDGRTVQLTTSLAGQRFEYRARGAQVATWESGFGLVVGKTRSSTFDPSVIRVDQVTGETVPIRSEAFLTTDLAFGSGNTLYTIGLFGTPADPTTRLVRLSGPRLDDDRQLAEYEGEDPGARVAWDSRTRTLYTTLGDDGIQQTSGISLEKMQNTGQLARDISIWGLLVATVNADGSVTLYDRSTGELLFDIYVFEDDSWLAIRPGGVFLSSGSGPEDYLDFIPAQRTRLQFDDFRMELPFRG